MQSKQHLSSHELEEISVIKNVGRRMATNSLIVKGWTVAALGTTLALSSTRYQALVGVLAVLVLWYLDAYFLRQKNAYNLLSRELAEHKLDIDDEFFELGTARREAGVQVPGSGALMLSTRLLVFYGPILTFMLAYVGYLSVFE